MKSAIKYILISFALLAVFPISASAVIADPKPKTVTQPDGTVITIQVHGDEFLNWTTCGGRLVAKASDGFYYYADFNADGTKKLSSVKVSDRPTTMGFVEVRPPQSAIMHAKELRQQFSSIMKRSSSSSPISVGKKRFLVMLVEFSDLHFAIKNPHQAFNDLCNKKGYSENGGTGSVADFYIDNSMEQFIPQFDVVGPVEVSQTHSHYASLGIGSDGAHLLADACKLLDKEVNFADYDLDGDGYIDNVFMFYAGYNQAEGAGKEYIWPHSGSAGHLNKYFDGKQLAHYACTSELRNTSGTDMAGIGTMCHEFGHVLGLWDYYDTDYETNGQAEGLWDLSLMSSGNYNNDGKTPPYLDACSRYLLGWRPEIITINSPGEKTLNNISTNAGYILETKTEGEYFLLESRDRSGWDKYAEGLGDGGLAVYHIDRSDNYVSDSYLASQLWTYKNLINAYPSHQCFDLVENVYPESDALSDDLIFPGRKNITTLSGKTNPSFLPWDGNALRILTDIRKVGDKVKLNVEVEDKVVKGKVENTAGNPISGVDISISETSVAAVGNISIKSVPAVAKVYSAVTDANGRFEINIGKNSATQYQLKASCTGYADYFKGITLISGEKALDIVMKDLIEDSYRDLRKFTDYKRSTLGSYNASDIRAKVEFYDYELVDYVGSMLKCVNLMLDGKSAKSLSVFVEIEGERIYEKNVDEPIFGSMFSVDITDENIIIPANRKLTIGYDIMGCDNGYPVVFDNDPNPKKGGGFYSIDGGDWTNIAVSGQGFWHGYEGNIVLSATVMPDNGKLSIKGFNYIISPKEIYSAGDVFEFRLSQSVRVVRNIKWSFDGKEVSGPSTVLQSGQHEIQAEVEYEGSKFETLVLEINVE